MTAAKCTLLPTCIGPSSASVGAARPTSNALSRRVPTSGAVRWNRHWSDASIASIGPIMLPPRIACIEEVSGRFSGNVNSACRSSVIPYPIILRTENESPASVSTCIAAVSLLHCPRRWGEASAGLGVLLLAGGTLVCCALPLLLVTLGVHGAIVPTWCVRGAAPSNADCIVIQFANAPQASLPGYPGRARRARAIGVCGLWELRSFREHVALRHRGHRRRAFIGDGGREAAALQRVRTSRGHPHARAAADRRAGVSSLWAPLLLHAGRQSSAMTGPSWRVLTGDDFIGVTAAE